MKVRFKSLLRRLVGKEVATTLGSGGAVAYIAYLIAAGVLAPPVGLVLAGLATATALVHIHASRKAKEKEDAKSQEDD